MHDAVDDRGGHVPVSEHIAPPPELQVRGGHHAPLLVGIRDDLEQEPGPVDVDRQVSELAQDDQVGPAHVHGHRVEAPVFGLAELEHKFRSLAEPHVHAPFHGSHAQSDCEVGLAPAGLAVEHQVLRAGHESRSMNASRWIGYNVLDSPMRDE